MGAIEDALKAAAELEKIKVAEFQEQVGVIGIEFLALVQVGEAVEDPFVFAVDAVLLADLTALAWVGLWGALTCKKPNHLAGMTVVRILAAPWILFIVISILANALIEDVPSDPILTWRFFIGLWFGLGVLTDLGFGLGAALHLRASFRALALQRYAPAKSPLARWFRRKRTV